MTNRLKTKAFLLAMVVLLTMVTFLFFLKVRQQSQRNACHNNLRQIHSAIVSTALADGYHWGDEIPVEAFSQDLKPDALKCPSGGEYNVPVIGGHPTCSIHGDLLKQSGELNAAPSQKESAILRHQNKQQSATTNHQANP